MAYKNIVLKIQLKTGSKSKDKKLTSKWKKSLIVNKKNEGEGKM